jgi:hypothetical protein
MPGSSVYVQMDRVQAVRTEADAILHMLQSEDTAALDACLQTLRDHLLVDFPGSTPRFKKTIDQTITSQDRSAKHALLFFGLYTSPEWCKMVLKTHRIPVAKFKRFYESSLKEGSQQLLDNTLVCIQEYIEHVRTEYYLT